LSFVLISESLFKSLLDEYAAAFSCSLFTVLYRLSY
jgi:hypothetical protein